MDKSVWTTNPLIIFPKNIDSNIANNISEHRDCVSQMPTREG